jgi:transposase InsO family protein
MAQYDDEAIDRQLSNLYYAAGDPAGYGGVERLYTRAKDLQIPVNRARVRQFLARQYTYTLHKPARHIFRRNQTLVHHKDQQWQADLAIMNALANENDGYKYILTCIDVLSRYAWAVPVRSKNANDMLAAMKELFQRAAPRKPVRLQTDKGTEFYNQQVKAFLAAQNVELFSTNSDVKAALAERFNRTLKSRIYKHFTEHQTKRYVDVLQDFVYAYNHAKHRTIGRPPADVETQQDEHDVWRRVYYDSKEAQLQRSDMNRARRIADGEYVRLSKYKANFEKGYVPSWGRELYEVVSKREPLHGKSHCRLVYKLRDMEGEPIEGACYPEEVQHIPGVVARTEEGKLPGVLEVERVLRKRKLRGGIQESLVKWRGWPDKFNRWLTRAELAHYQQSPRQQQQQA